MEKWLPIKGYEDKYLISNLGRIKTLSRPVFRKNGKLHYTQKDKFLNPTLLPIGYYYIGLHNSGNFILKTIHSLVALHFLENKEKRKTVNHIDGNKKNNNVTNLQWATYSENNIHAYRKGLKKCYGVVAKNAETKKETIFKCIYDAVKMGFKQASISLSIKEKRKYNGYFWKYTGETSYYFGSSAGGKENAEAIRKMAQAE